MFFIIKDQNTMSLTFEKKPLLLGLSGGIAINAAIVAMNTFPTRKLQMAGGIPFFTLGWGLIIKSFLYNSTRAQKFKAPLVASSLGVYSMAMLARLLTDSGNTGTPVKVSKMLFLAFWISIGIFLGMKKASDEVDELDEEDVHSPLIHALGLIPPAFVVLSMSSINIVERPRGIASGPGMPIFMLAWVVLSLVNSFEFQDEVQDEL